MSNNFWSGSDADLTPEYRNVCGHVEVYIDGRFFCSADSRREADTEFHDAFGGHESDAEYRSQHIRNVRREIRYGS